MEIDGWIFDQQLIDRFLWIDRKIQLSIVGRMDICCLVRNVRVVPSASD